jgi:hypothetical protein
MDIEAILETIAGIRSSIPAIDDSVSTRRVTFDGRCLFPDHLEGADPSRYFEVLTVIEALESLAEELAASVRKDVVLRGYHGMLDDLARDPANAHLRFCVEVIRIAYEEDFGAPIPPAPPGDTQSTEET